MTNFSVTLADLRKGCACFGWYNKVVRAIQGREFSEEDEARESYIRFSHKDSISIESIAHSNGLDDALWALRCVKGADRDLRLYAVWCARQVQHLMLDQRSSIALDIAEKFADGEASEEERAAAWAAADAAADAVGDAAWDAAGAAAGDAQKDMLIKMCNGQAPWQMGKK